jgi:hypothetical protein
MRRFFTKHLFLMVLSFAAVDMTGQAINALTVNSPAGIAGNYEVIRAGFGSTSNTPITTNAAFASYGNNVYDGCMAPTNALTGNIAFVDRGTCSFVIKAANIQAKGAVAVIICQNADVWPFQAGGTDASITVPVFTMSLADCNKIRVDIISGGANVSLQYVCSNSNPQYGPEVIWGKNPGEGDFTGGLNGWTIDKDNTWNFSDKPEILEGAFGGTTMNSFTSCDGIAYFNSDFLDNNGDPDQQGLGPCPAVCTGALISPNIDLTGQEIKGLTIEFSQATRQFRSVYYLIASKDNGVTWSDTILLNTELPVNSSVIRDRRKVALSGYAGATQLRFKFEYAGNYYYWGVDDIVVRNELLVDSRVNTNFFAVASTIRVPQTQVSPMPFLADISNIGNGDDTGVTLEVVISEGTNEVARLENVYGNLAAGSTIENVLFPEQFTPEAKPAQYNARYEIVSDGDNNPANNVVPFSFEVTENTFGTVLPESQITPANYMNDVTTFWAVTPTNYYSAGNAYFLPNGKGFAVDKVRFGLANPLAEVDGTGFIRVDLYEWNEGVNDRACTVTERKLVGSNNLFVSSDDISNPRLIEVDLFAVDDAGEIIEDKEVLLKDNQTYLLVAHTNPLEVSSPRYRFLCFSGTNQTNVIHRSIYTEANNYIYSTLEEEKFAGSLWNIDGVDENDISERIYDQLGNPALLAYATVYMEMDIKTATSSTYDIAKTGTATVFPNPASRELYIDVTLDNISSNVRVDLVTIEGKVATSKSFSNVQDSRLKLDLSGLTSGTYTAMIHTDNGVIAKKVVVQK